MFFSSEKYTLKDIMREVKNPGLDFPKPTSGKGSLLFRHHGDRTVMYVDPLIETQKGDVYIPCVEYTWDAIRPILLENRGKFSDGEFDPSKYSPISKECNAVEEMAFWGIKAALFAREGSGAPGPMNKTMDVYPTVVGYLHTFGMGRPDNIPPDWVEVYRLYSKGDGWVPSSLNAIYVSPENARRAREIALKWGLKNAN